MMQTVVFLNQVVTDPSLQAEIRAGGITFEVIQTAALRRGYQVTEEALNTALAENPVLLGQVTSLLNTVEMDYELDEAEMALISGGAPICCVNCSGPNVYTPGEFKYL